MTPAGHRNGKPVQLSVQAIQNIQGSYQLGVWLRDSMAGIGTMTFMTRTAGCSLPWATASTTWIRPR